MKAQRKICVSLQKTRLFQDAWLQGLARTESWCTMWRSACVEVGMREETEVCPCSGHEGPAWHTILPADHD
ncbi:hypothetical protein ROHU_033157 [Labeo rohita]|uniref:Uncharacterized protein n=1 Tax=Labeo rohita TaxID=84645 RepID=A0A498LFT9_LABRO|nr:hypothetical protein ROHU_033157 [Labeo rohita]